VCGSQHKPRAPAPAWAAGCSNMQDTKAQGGLGKLSRDWGVLLMGSHGSRDCC